MYYIQDAKTGKVVYLSRFLKCAKRYINMMRAGLQFIIVHDSGRVIE